MRAAVAEICLACVEHTEGTQSERSTQIYCLGALSFGPLMPRSGWLLTDLPRRRSR